MGRHTWDVVAVCEAHCFKIRHTWDVVAVCEAHC